MISPELNEILGERSLSGAVWYNFERWSEGANVVSGLSSSKVSACIMLIKEFCGGKAGWNDRAVFIEIDFRQPSVRAECGRTSGVIQSRTK